jgi:hypothetical protein
MGPSILGVFRDSSEYLPWWVKQLLEVFTVLGGGMAKWIVPSSAAAGRQGCLPAGSAPLQGAFSPEKALKSGLFLAFSAGLDWRVGNPASPQPLSQWQPGHRSSLHSDEPSISDRRGINPINYSILISAQTRAGDACRQQSSDSAERRKKTAFHGFFRREGTWEALIDYVPYLAFSRARYQGAGLKACVGLSKTGNAESGFG